MKILFLAFKTPYPAGNGAATRAYYSLVELAKRHNVSLAYWVGVPSEGCYVNSLRNLCEGGSVTPVYLNRTLANIRGARALLQGRSFAEGYFGDASFQTEIERLEKKERFDLVYVFSSVMAQYALDRFRTPIVIDFVDLELSPSGLVSLHDFTFVPAPFGLEQRRLLRLSRSVAGRAMASIFSGQAESERFHRAGGKALTYVMPSGVGLELRRLPINESRAEIANERNKEPKLIFLGALDSFVNRDAVNYFMQEILPLVKKRYPSAGFEVLARAATKVARWFPGADGKQVVRDASEVRARLVKADVIVAPLRVGGNFEHIIREALALGVPVVASSETLKGLAPLSKQEVLVGDNPKDFADHVLGLLDDCVLYRRVAARGCKFAAEHFGWKAFGANLARLVEELTASRRLQYLEATRGAS